MSPMGKPKNTNFGPGKKKNTTVGPGKKKGEVPIGYYGDPNKRKDTKPGGGKNPKKSHKMPKSY